MMNVNATNMSDELAAITGIVVAGGHSRRLGQDKRRLQLWGAAGPTLLAHSVALLGDVCQEVIVVLNDPAAWPALPARLVPDLFPDTGPLGGLASGLQAMQTTRALVLAADLPLVSTALLRWLAQPSAADAVVPRTADGRWQPLAAAYHVRCLPIIYDLLNQKNYRLHALLALLSVEPLAGAELAALDPAGELFLNLNTPADIAVIQRILKANYNSAADNGGPHNDHV